MGHKELIQVSYDLLGEKTVQRELRALNSAGELLHLENKTLVTWDDEMELADGIRVVPIWKFLVENKNE